MGTALNEERVDPSSGLTSIGQLARSDFAKMVASLAALLALGVLVGLALYVLLSLGMWSGGLSRLSRIH